MNTVETVREILARNAEVVAERKIAVRGPKGHFIGAPRTVLVVQGAAVSTPFRRNYLKNKLAKFGAAVQKTARGSGFTEILI